MVPQKVVLKIREKKNHIGSIGEDRCMERADMQS
jgi:hypothetical protein